MKTENGNLISTPSGTSFLVSSSPGVKLGSLTLMRHKMTLTLPPSGVELCFSHFSKDLIRPCLRGTKLVLALLINFLSLRQGECPKGERVDKNAPYEEEEDKSQRKHLRDIANKFSLLLFRASV